MDPSNNMSTNLETPNCGTFTCLPSFVAGIVGLALVEFVLVLYLLGKFLKVTSRRSTTVSSDLNLNVNCEDGTISLQVNISLHTLCFGDVECALVAIVGGAFGFAMCTRREIFMLLYVFLNLIGYYTPDALFLPH